MKWLADKLDPYSALLTALATIYLAVLTRYLAIYADDPGHISGRQLKAMQTSERAYIVPRLDHPIEIVSAGEKDEKGGDWKIRPVWINRGKARRKPARMAIWRRPTCGNAALTI